MPLDPGTPETVQNTPNDLEDSAQQFEELIDQEEQVAQPETDEDETTEDDDLKLSDEESEEPDSQSPEQSLVEILGEKKPAKEWKEGFLRQDDYTRKAQALAQQRAYLDQEMAHVTDSRKKYAAGLGLLTHEAENNLKQFEGVDWAYMAQVNQEDYIKFKSQYDVAKEKLAHLQQKSEEFFNSVTEHDKVLVQKKAVDCVNVLKNVFSNWNKDAYYGLIEYGTSIGMDQNALLNNTDPGVFIMLHKARQHDKGKQLTNKLKNQKQTGSRVLSGKGQRINSGNKQQQVKAKLQQTGSLEDAVSVFESMV